MGRPLTVNIPHSLSRQEARRRIEDGFNVVQSGMTGALSGVLAFENRWEGERLHFAGNALGQKLTGCVDIGDDAVQIQVDLPDLLVALADRIKASLTKGTVKLLQNSK